MPKRPSRKASPEQPVPRSVSPHDAAIDALTALLAERSYGEIGLDEIAARAGLSMSGLRAAHRSKLAILSAFVERVDLAVLARGAAEGDNERDRLFDVLMRRFDELARHKAALRSLARSAPLNPALACAMGYMSDRSMMWMLAAAHVAHDGFLGRVARSGAGMVFAEAMRTWLDDDDPKNEKTMAALDRALSRGERAMGYLRDACDFIASLRRRTRGATTGTQSTSP